MNRRAILKLLSGLLTGALAHKGIAAAPRKRILVIGAGLAGLAAARELRNLGHDVLVLEARNRIGGRVWTSTRWTGMPMDLGASWIHGVTGNPMTMLAQTIRTPTVLTNYDSSITYNTAGLSLSAGEENHLQQLTDDINLAIELAQAKSTDQSIDAAVADLVRQLPADDLRLVNSILNDLFEQEYGGSTSKLSAYWFDNIKEFSGDDAVFLQGFQTIPMYLAQGTTILLNQTVKEIQSSLSPVRVLTTTAEYFADYVLVTLPLGVLKANKVKFTPSLPKAKADAITALGMGILDKCYLRFATAFWPSNVDWLQYIPARRGEWAEWVSFMRTSKLPVLVGFNAADKGREIEAWTDTQTVSSAMQTLRIMFGRSIPDPLDYQITRWGTDPFSLGSYSFNALGATPKMRQQLAAPLSNRVFFAGEATDTYYFGATHGAYLSGLRAAKEIASVAVI